MSGTDGFRVLKYTCANMFCCNFSLYRLMYIIDPQNYTNWFSILRDNCEAISKDYNLRYSEQPFAALPSVVIFLAYFKQQDIN